MRILGQTVLPSYFVRLLNPTNLSSLFLWHFIDISDKETDTWLKIDQSWSSKKKKKNQKYRIIVAFVIDSDVWSLVAKHQHHLRMSSASILTWFQRNSVSFDSTTQSLKLLKIDYAYHNTFFGSYIRAHTTRVMDLL